MFEQIGEKGRRPKYIQSKILKFTAVSNSETSHYNKPPVPLCLTCFITEVTCIISIYCIYKALYLLLKCMPSLLFAYSTSTIPHWIPAQNPTKKQSWPLTAMPPSGHMDVLLQMSKACQASECNLQRFLINSDQRITWRKYVCIVFETQKLIIEKINKANTIYYIYYYNHTSFPSICKHIDASGLHLLRSSLS